MREICGLRISTSKVAMQLSLSPRCRLWLGNYYSSVSGTIVGKPHRLLVTLLRPGDSMPGKCIYLFFGIMC